MGARKFVVSAIAVVSVTGCAGFNGWATAITSMAAANQQGIAQAQQQQVSPTMYVYGGADHKTFLGCFCSEIDQNSLINPISPFGSSISQTSIFNHIGMFGAPFGQYSACSSLASDPPIVVTASGQAVGRLTLNSYTPGAMTQPDIVAWLRRVCSK